MLTELTGKINRTVPALILIEQRWDDDWMIDGARAPCWIGVDLASGRALWRTWSMSEESCCAACAEEYPEAALCAVVRPVERGVRL